MIPRASGGSPALNGVRATRRRPPELTGIVGTIGASGQIAESWTIPDLGSGIQARLTVVQSLHFAPSLGQWVLGTPNFVVLLDQAF